MKEALIIGSAVADVIINVDRLPETGGDVNALGQTISLGGCAYNVYRSASALGAGAIFFSPAGTGIYGDFVRGELKKRGIVSPIPRVEGENGCCYCFVEQNGERSFVCHRGAEYAFHREWFGLINSSDIESAYFCGLELEEEGGEAILDYLEAHPQWKLHFAPGPRFEKLHRDRIFRALSLGPVLHLNEDEALRLRGAAAEAGCIPQSPGEAGQSLAALTGRAAIVTCGERGAVCFLPDGRRIFEAAVPVCVVDTIGAGDAHAGAVIACRQKGCSWEETLKRANAEAAKVVEIKGAGK